MATVLVVGLPAGVVLTLPGSTVVSGGSVTLSPSTPPTTTNPGVFTATVNSTFWAAWLTSGQGGGTPSLIQSGALIQLTA